MDVRCPDAVLSAPDGPHVGPMNLAIWEYILDHVCHEMMRLMLWEWALVSTRMWLINSLLTSQEN